MAMVLTLIPSTHPFPLLLSPIPSPKRHQFPLLHLPPKALIPKSNPNPSTKMVVRAESFQTLASGAVNLLQSNPSTWQSALLSNFLIFVGTAATKVKMAQKEAQGVAEKRKGRRGPGSVIGSSAAGCVCALFMINKVGGEAFAQLWRLGFVASFCTKLSDTVSSEIGKAYGRITYLVTTFKVVPRGTEGAVSLEGTFAGLLAAIALAIVGCLLGDVTAPEAIVCVIASQIANLGESLIGAVFQEKEGFQWLNNDVVNVINISLGSILAILMQQLILGH